jgi:predicted nucleotidyltransferase
MDIEKAILYTLSYSDIFNYPLTLEQIWFYLIYQVPVSIGEVERVVKKSKKISRNNELHCLKGREEIFAMRNSRKSNNKEKVQIAKYASKILAFIPTITFIGISGAVAMGNAKEEDDIDFVILVQKNSLWITRLLCIALLDTLQLRRKRKIRKVANKICLNLFISSDYVFGNSMQNIYTAHEVVQIMPLLNRNNSYLSFLKNNNWTKKLLPNSFEREGNYVTNNKPVFKNLVPVLIMLEPIAKYLQLLIMKKHITSEVLTSNILAFHPYNYNQKIVNGYLRKIKKFS